MRTFAKILGFTEEHPVRTLIARVLLAILVLLGIRGLRNPDISGYLTAPFIQSERQLLVVSPTDMLRRGEEDGQIIALTNEQIDEIPSLEDYLSKLTCSGCGRRCLLTNLGCGRGKRYKEAAEQEYEEQYNKDENRNESDVEETIPGTNEKSGVTIIHMVGIMSIFIAGTYYTLELTKSK